jgi:GMP synthase-like glutamine amidotransferase
VSAVAQGSLYGLQFHPEKSSEAGLRVLANFLGLVAASKAGATPKAGVTAPAADSAGVA